MIRDLRKTDAPRVLDLLKIGFPEEEGLIGTSPEGFAKVVRRIYRWDTQFVVRLARLFGRPLYRFFVDEEDGRLVATTLLTFPERTGFVSMVSVDPAYRRRGIARALLEHARTTTVAAGRQFIALSVLTQNLSARTLYERIGYRHLYDASLFVWEPGPAANGGPASAVRPFHHGDSRALTEIALRTVPPEVQQVLPVREGSLRVSGFVNRILGSETTGWVIDGGNGAEAYLAATSTPATNSGNCSDPIVGEGVDPADAVALVRTAVDWCTAHGAHRLLTRVPTWNVRGRAALQGGGFHETLTDSTLYRRAA